MRGAPKILAAGLLCLLLAGSLFFSEWFLAREIHHDCTGAGCPVCACLQQAAGRLHAGGPSAAAATARAAAGFAAVAVLGCAAAVRRGATPVSRKVRLDN